jgi:protein-S-isoprenylcysteine O-methyltransferase Ste14
MSVKGESEMPHKKMIALACLAVVITLAFVTGKSVFNENLMEGIFALSIYILLIIIGLLLLILPAIGMLAVYQMLKERINR